MTEAKPKMKIFISQKMTGRRDGEIRNERWYVSELCKLVYGRPNLEIEIIDQYDLPLPEDHYKMTPNQLGITLLGRSISLMNVLSANIIILNESLTGVKDSLKLSKQILTHFSSSFII